MLRNREELRGTQKNVKECRRVWKKMEEQQIMGRSAEEHGGTKKIEE